jgi:hypothetical protein
MNSEQLVSIETLPRQVAIHLRKFIGHLMAADFETALHCRQRFAQTAKSLEATFESSLPIISHHFIFLISDTDRTLVQNSFKTWYLTWCKQFNLAMQNFKSAI